MAEISFKIIINYGLKNYLKSFSAVYVVKLVTFFDWDDKIIHIFTNFDHESLILQQYLVNNSCSVLFNGFPCEILSPLDHVWPRKGPKIGPRT